MHQRAVKERDQLSQLHLITSCEELKKALSEIDELPVSVKKKSESKRALLREQINIRKKVLKQNINIPFTHRGRQRALKDVNSPTLKLQILKTSAQILKVTVATLQNHWLESKFSVSLKLKVQRNGTLDMLWDIML